METGRNNNFHAPYLIAVKFNRGEVCCTLQMESNRHHQPGLRRSSCGNNEFNGIDSDEAANRHRPIGIDMKDGITIRVCVPILNHSKVMFLEIENIRAICLERVYD